MKASATRHWIRSGLLCTAMLVAVGCGTSSPEGSVDASAIATAEGLAGVAREFLDDPDRMRRMRRLASLLEAVPTERYGELARIIESRAVIPRQEDVGLIMHAWARRAPEAALAQAVDWKLRGVSWTEPIPDHVVSEVLYAWSQDPEADVESAIADAPTELRPLFLVAVVRGWSESGQIARATRVVAEQPEGFGQLLVTVLTERLVEDEGIEAAIAWAEAIAADTPLRVHAFRRTAGVVARLDPERAAAWATSVAGERHAAGMARALGQEWAKRVDPAVVLDWIDDFPDEGERREAATWVFQDWHRRSRDAAMAWLQRREPLEVMYRPVLDAHVGMLLQSGPAGAIDWIEGMADADRRRDAELALAQRWLAKDEEAAQDWIREAGLEVAVAESIARREEARARRRQGVREGSGSSSPAPEPKPRR